MAWGLSTLLGVLGLAGQHAVAADIYVAVGVDGGLLYATQKLDDRYELLMRGVPDNLTARPEARKQTSKNKRVEPDASGPYRQLIDEIAHRHGVDASLVKAVVHVESRYRPQAVSEKGAVGLMQLMPDTAKRFGVASRVDPAQNLEGGIRYLKVLLSRFEGNISLALASYNAGEGAVERYGRQIPPYKETIQYVAAVIAQHGRESDNLSQ